MGKCIEHSAICKSFRNRICFFMKLFSFFAFILLCLLISCSPAKNIQGTYRSNKPLLGFLVTEFTFNGDSSFKYHSIGDVTNIKSKGYYKIVEDKIFLLYDFPVMDTSMYKYYRANGLSVEDDMKKAYAQLPKIFIIKHNKLFFTVSNGNIIRRAKLVEKYFFKRVK